MERRKASASAKSGARRDPARRQRCDSAERSLTTRLSALAPFLGGRSLVRAHRWPELGCEETRGARRRARAVGARPCGRPAFVGGHGPAPTVKKKRENDELFCSARPKQPRFPGAAQHGAKRNGALQTRDRYERGVWEGPGSAVHRCALHRIRETGPLWRPPLSRGRRRRERRHRMAPNVAEMLLRLACKPGPPALGLRPKRAGDHETQVMEAGAR